MRRTRTMFLFVIAGVIVITSPSSLAAQSGTASADSRAAGSCTSVEPRGAEFFQSLAGTPAAATEDGSGSQAADATPTPFAMPEGETADEATAAEVGALYEQLIACVNAGDFLRVYALYSDDYVQRNLSEELLSTLPATPVPSEQSMQSEFGGVLDARVLDDGRIAALVTTSNPQSGEVILFAILRRDSDRLRIDEEQVVEAETPTAAAEGTPAA